MTETRSRARSSTDASRRLSTSQNITAGRLRATSASAATRLLVDANPSRGMWVATAQAIAHAPNIGDLRSPALGGENITFDAHGHSAREKDASLLEDEYFGRLLKGKAGSGSSDATLDKNATKQPAESELPAVTIAPTHDELKARIKEEKTPWTAAVKHGLSAFWKFFTTPTGFLITIYGLNVVAWGAMLFFLLLNAAPAMCHPSCNAHNSSRKIWIEITSQILNALFCLTAWGLAPWRFRDLYWLGTWRFSQNHIRSRAALHSLVARNSSWFRMREGDLEEHEVVQQHSRDMRTFTGNVAPATAGWKLDFFVWMNVSNTLLQVGMAFMMWHYDRIDRPSWGAGLFIGLGCAVSMFAGLMSWWEARKIKIIEGPKIIS